MIEDKNVTCPQCGGVFSQMLPVCPFCGTLNPHGAEKAYMEKLEKLRTGMGEMQDDIEQTYARNLKKTGFRLGKVFLAVIIIVGLLAAILIGMMTAERVRYDKETKAELAFRKTYFSELDALHAAGDDDAVLAYLETLYELDGSAALGSWSHYDYYYLYRRYKTVRMVQEDALEMTDRDLVIDAAYYALQAARLPENGLADMRLSAQEKEKALIWQQEEAVFLTEVLNLSETEIDQLYEASLNAEYQYLEFRKFERVFGEMLDKRTE